MLTKIKSEHNFNNQLNNVFIEYKKDFILEKNHSTRTIIYDKKNNSGYVFRNRLTDQEMKKLWIFRQIKECFVKYLKNNPNFKVYEPVLNIFHNHKAISDLKMGQYFMSTDAKHCYWRVAYLLGYINKEIYDKLATGEFKMERNKAMACLCSVRTITTYKKGKIKKSIQIGNPELNMLYQNVRNYAHFITRKAGKAAGKDLLKYKTDCVYYHLSKKEKVEEVFKKYDILFETNECTYIANREFLEKKNIYKL